MALSARFGADFTELLNAFSDVEVKIRSVADQAARSAPQFSRLVNELNGQKVQREAALIVAAVNKVGDASLLTAAEQQRVNTVLQQYIDKARVMGQTVPPEMLKMAEATKHVAAETQKLPIAASSAAASLKELAGAFGLTFGIGAAAMGIKAFASSMFELGDTLTKMESRTGIGIEALQDLSTVAMRGGTDIQTLAGAINMMQKRLAGGDDSAAGALKYLKINFDVLRAMAPDQQFYTISKSIMAIDDAAMRAKLRTDLMGKGANEVADAMAQDFDAARRDTEKMSAGMAIALDTAGERLQLWFSNIKKYTAGVVVAFFSEAARIGESAVRVIYQGFALIQNAIAKTLELGSKLAGFGGEKTLEIGLAMLAHNARTNAQEMLDAANLIKAGWDQGELSALRLATAVRSGTVDLDGYGKKTKEAKTAQQLLDEVLKSSTLSLHDWNEGLWKTASEGEKAFIKGLDEILELSDKLLLSLPSTQAHTASLWDQVGKDIDKVAGKTTHLGTTTTESARDYKKALGNVADGFDGLSRVAEMSGHKTTAAIASVASTTIKAFVQGGPVAGAIAFATSALTAFGDALFKTEQRKVNDLRDAFLSAQGGFAALHATLAKVGSEAAFLALLNAKKTKDWEAALAKVNTILQKNADLEALRASSVPTWKTISALVEKYGIDLKTAGLAAQQLFVNDAAATLMNDWQTWSKMAGDDMAVFANASKTQFSTLVQQAMAFGTTLPQNMKPMLQSLIDQGLLLDKNGKKIEDLEGLTFGGAVQTEMDRLAKSIDDLVAELRVLNGLPPVNIAGVTAAQNERFAARAAAGDMNTEYSAPAWGGEQARGGDYWVTRPTLFLAGERGPERATFRPAGTPTTTSIVEGAVTVNVTIHAVNAEGVRDLVERELLPRVVEAVRGNRRQARTDLRAALGVR